jgi:flagellar assembly factor FliW
MVQDDFIISFPEGLLGYQQHTSFALLEPKDGYPLKFLQSMVDPGISFTCMDAASVKLDYEVPLAPADAEALALHAQEDAMVLLIVTVPGDDPRRTTANLAGPLVLNVRTRTGRQVVLDSSVYPLQHPVFTARGEALLQFPAGLIGYPALKTYRLYEPKDGYPLKFLQAAEREDVSFTCIDVQAIKPDYVVPLSDSDAQELAIHEPADALILALVVIPEDPTRMTANLAGPVVVNIRTLQARQIVLNIDQFPLAYPVFSGK